MADTSTHGNYNTLEQYLKDGSWVDRPEALPWYTKDLIDLELKTSELFEIYSKVPPDKVVFHITQIRNKAFSVFPYPCLGDWRFLNLSIQRSAIYDEILQRIKGGEQYLDIGCCMGQDIRKLVYDGAPSENTYASDLNGKFWDIGYDLFLDKSSLKTTFVEADVFDNESGLQQLTGKIDIIHAASFFHLFNWNQQVIAAKRLVELLNGAQSNLIVGRQAGRLETGDFTAQAEREKSTYWHNHESWAKLWEQVGNETGAEWKVETDWDEKIDLFHQKAGMADFIPQDTKLMKFIIRRAR